MARRNWLMLDTALPRQRDGTALFCGSLAKGCRWVQFSPQDRKSPAGETSARNQAWR
jgi:hypothetical protein